MTTRRNRRLVHTFPRIHDHGITIRPPGLAPIKVVNREGQWWLPTKLLHPYTYSHPRMSSLRDHPLVRFVIPGQRIQTYARLSHLLDAVHVSPTCTWRLHAVCVGIAEYMMPELANAMSAAELAELQERIKAEIKGMING